MISFNPNYLFTSLASLAIKNPRVPSCIFTLFPGLMRMLGNQRKRHIMLINFWKTSNSCTQHANQEEWYTAFVEAANRTCFFLFSFSTHGLIFIIYLVIPLKHISDVGQFDDVILTRIDRMYNSMIPH